MKKHGDKLSPCSHNSVVLQFVFSLFLFQILFCKRLFCKIAAFVRRNAVVGGGLSFQRNNIAVDFDIV